MIGREVQPSLYTEFYLLTVLWDALFVYVGGGKDWRYANKEFEILHINCQHIGTHHSALLIA